MWGFLGFYMCKLNYPERIRLRELCLWLKGPEVYDLFLKTTQRCLKWYQQPIAASPKINSKSSQKKAVCSYNQQLVTHRLRLNDNKSLFDTGYIDFVTYLYPQRIEEHRTYIRKSVKKCHGPGTLKQCRCFEEMAVKLNCFIYATQTLFAPKHSHRIFQ